MYPKDYEVPDPPEWTDLDASLVNNQRVLVNFWCSNDESNYRVRLSHSLADSDKKRDVSVLPLRKRLIRDVGGHNVPAELLAESLAPLGVKKRMSPRKAALRQSLKSLEEAEGRGGDGAEEGGEDGEQGEEGDDDSVGAGADYEITRDFEDNGDDGADDGGGDERDYGGIL